MVPSDRQSVVLLQQGDTLGGIRTISHEIAQEPDLIESPPEFSVLDDACQGLQITVDIGRYQKPQLMLLEYAELAVWVARSLRQQG